MGSKSKICESVCRLFPNAENFYDLFGGGFSITHFMLKHRHKDFKQFHFNELRPGICDLVKDAIDGKYSYEKFSPPWVSRDDFMQNKDSDIYKKIVWSFGNNGKDYLFGKEIEQDKKSMHMAIVFNEFDEYAKSIFGIDKFKDGYGINEKRLYLKNRLRVIGKYRNDNGVHDILQQLERLQQLQQLQQLERLQQLQQLEQLEQLQRLEQLHFYNMSYEAVPIKSNSIIYCDIPYGFTAGYDRSHLDFNRKKFFDWAHELDEPVFISEYNVEDARFKCIANFKKRSLLSSDKSNNLIKTEKVYVNESGYKAVLKSRQAKQLKR